MQTTKIKEYEEIIKELDVEIIKKWDREETQIKIEKILNGEIEYVE